jgi:nickel superoxide dismutase
MAASCAIMVHLHVKARIDSCIRGRIGMKMRRTALLTSVFLLVFCAAQPVMAHCEIPCGIYGDRMRVDMLEEHFQTVEKSMKLVDKLKKEPAENANQLVRWVNNKELHANKIQEIVYQYFMNQRIKPAEKTEGDKYDKYVKEITLLHRMLVQAMKCKQTTDRNHVEKLRSLLDMFEASYFKGKKHHHE